MITVQINRWREYLFDAIDEAEAKSFATFWGGVILGEHKSKDDAATFMLLIDPPLL